MRRALLVLGLCLLAAAPSASARRAGAGAPARRAADPDQGSANQTRARTCLDRARTAAGEDRHVEAIRWYREAIALYPPFEADLGKELGHQYTWAEKPDSAIVWYRLHLSHHPDDIEAEMGIARALAWAGRLDASLDAYQALLPRAGEYETEVRLGIAQVTSWKDDLAGARTIYEGILRDDPENLDARLGRARVVNWAGRHREAAGLYRDILNDHPDNGEAREGLARADYWMGNPGEARTLIEDGGHAGGLAALELDMNRARAPAGSYTFERSTDSDEIERTQHTFQFGVSAGDLTRYLGEYGHGLLEQPGRPDVSRDWASAALERRLNEAAMIHAEMGYQWNAFDGTAPGTPGDAGDFNLLTIDAYLTLTPRDWWRFDLSLFRGSLNVPDAIFHAITVTEGAAGWDLRFRTDLMLVSSLEISGFSDGNHRLGAGEKLVWQPIWRLPVSFAHRFTSSTGAGYFGFSETNDNGYYDPRQYLSLYEELAVNMTFSPRVRGHLAGRVGLDRENGDDWFDTGRFEASATIAIWRGLALTAGYYNSNSRLDSREGYQADGFYLTLGYVHAQGD